MFVVREYQRLAAVVVAVDGIGRKAAGTVEVAGTAEVADTAADKVVDTAEEAADIVGAVHTVDRSFLSSLQHRAAQPP